MVGYVRKTLSCLERHQVAFEHMATGISSFSLVVPTAALADCRDVLVQEIQQEVDPDVLDISDGVAMIAVVTEDCFEDSMRAIYKKFFDK